MLAILLGGIEDNIVVLLLLSLVGEAAAESNIMSRLEGDGLVDMIGYDGRCPF